MTIHWCGTGLSAIPGLRKLIESGKDVTVWNRTIEKAQEAVGDLSCEIRTFDIDDLGAELDRERSKRLFEMLSALDAQVLATAVEPPHGLEAAGSNVTMFHVKHGRVETMKE